MRGIYTTLGAELEESLNSIISKQGLQVDRQSKVFSSHAFDFASRTVYINKQAHEEEVVSGVFSRILSTLSKRGENISEVPLSSFLAAQSNVLTAHEIGHAHQTGLFSNLPWLARVTERAHNPYYFMPREAVFSYYKNIAHVSSLLTIERDAWERAEKLFPKAAQLPLWQESKRVALSTYERALKGIKDVTPSAHFREDTIRTWKYFGVSDETVQQTLHEAEELRNIPEEYWERVAARAEAYGERSAQQILTGRVETPKKAAGIFKFIRRRPTASATVGATAAGSSASAGAAKEVLEAGRAAWNRIPVAGKLFGAAAGVGTAAYLIARKRGMKSPDKEKQTHFAALVGGGLSVGMHLAGKGGPGVRGAVFLGATYGIGATVDMLRGQGLAALGTNAVSVAAGIGAYHGAQKLADKGLQSLRTAALLNQKTANGMAALTSALERAKGVHPIFANFLSKETLGIGAAMVAIPIANHIIQRAIKHWHRHPTHEAQAIKHGSDHEAGRTGGHRAPTTMAIPQQYEPATVTVRGNVRTRYNHGAARESL